MGQNSVLEILDRPSPSGRELGDEGERIAADHLRRCGFRLIMSNFTVPVGRNMRGQEVTGEIDLIALDGETLCFIEVKTRRSNELFEPSAAVTLRKQRQILRTANIYRRVFNVYAMPYRFDVVGIVWPIGGQPRIELLKGYWSDAKFRKRLWRPEFYGDID